MEKRDRRPYIVRKNIYLKLQSVENFVENFYSLALCESVVK